MREIKFRGMTVSGEWVYGNLAIIPKKVRSGPEKGVYISNSVGMPFAYEVRPETVGQFTGEKGRNNKDIYEGDILVWDNKTDDPDSTIDPIRFEGGRFSDGLDALCDLDLDSMEAIGTIHTTPELLKKEKTNAK